MLSIMFCIGVMIIGYNIPKLSGWLLLATSPFLISLGNLIIIDDPIIPFRFSQLIFAASIGIACSASIRKRLFLLLPNLWPIVILVVFMAMEFLYWSVQPELGSFKFIFLNLYPSYIAAILLTFSMIRTVDDLNRMVSILIFTAVLISILAIVENLTYFNVSHYLCYINIEHCDIDALHWAPASLRSGEYILPSIDNPNLFKRYAGFTGQPNSTAIILAMFSIFFLARLTQSRGQGLNRYFNLLFTITVMLGCVMVLAISHTRAAIFAFALIFGILGLRNKKIFFLMLLFCVVFLIFFIANDDANNWLSLFIENRLSSKDVLIDDQRSRALSNSIDSFLGSFGAGVGGDIWSFQSNYLNDDDLSAYLRYFAVGGFPLGFAYLTAMGAMVMNLSRCMRRCASKEHKVLIALFQAAILIVLVASIFNEHGLVFYIIFFYGAARASLVRAPVSG